MKFSFPKIELHLHLDGSLVLEDTWEMALQQGLVKKEDGFESFRRRMQVPQTCRNLADYLKCFQLADAVLQTPEALERASRSLCCSFPGKALFMRKSVLRRSFIVKKA